MELAIATLLHKVLPSNGAAACTSSTSTVGRRNVGAGEVAAGRRSESKRESEFVCACVFD